MKPSIICIVCILLIAVCCIEIPYQYDSESTYVVTSERHGVIGGKIQSNYHYMLLNNDKGQSMTIDCSNGLCDNMYLGKRVMLKSGAVDRNSFWFYWNIFRTFISTIAVVILLITYFVYLYGWWE